MGVGGLLRDLREDEEEAAGGGTDLFLMRLDTSSIDFSYEGTCSEYLKKRFVRGKKQIDNIYHTLLVFCTE